MYKQKSNTYCFLNKKINTEFVIVILLLQYLKVQVCKNAREFRKKMQNCMKGKKSENNYLNQFIRGCDLVRLIVNNIKKLTCSTLTI